MSGLRAAFYHCTAHEMLLAPARRALVGHRVMALMYHEVLDDDCGIDAWTVVRQTDFSRQMDYLRRHFTVVTLAEAAEALRARRGGPLAAVTFDDGYAGNLRVALPIVESLGIPVTIFVATAAVASGAPFWYDRVILACQDPRAADVDLRSFGLRRYRLPPAASGVARWNGIQEILTDLKPLAPARRGRAVAAVEATATWMPTGLRPLSVADLQRLAASPQVTIGSHSHCHNRLCQLSSDALAETMATSKRLLESWTGRRIDTFSYPNGECDARSIAAVRRHGFSLAVTNRPRAWAPADSRFEIPRVGIGRYDGWNRFTTIASGILL